MKTLEIKLFKFEELSEEAKQKAIEEYRSKNDDIHWQNEHQGTLEKFCSIFPIKWQTWDIYSGIDYKITCEDNIAELKGIRLMKYIYNNFGNDIFKGKYYGKLIPHAKDKEHPAGLEHIKFNSKCEKDHSCVLTGFCADEDILQPIYDFLKNPKESVTFADVLSDCLESWLIALKNDYEGQQSDEYISDFLSANEYDFTEDGEIY